MNILPLKRQLQSRISFKQMFIPLELITEILSLLNVKDIQRFRCVSKSWNTFIFDSTFTKRHLEVPSRNPHLVLSIPECPLTCVVSVPVQRLLETQSITVVGDIYLSLKWGISEVVGSCNGLICVLFKSITNVETKYKFCLWNPATRTISEKLGIFCENEPLISPFKFSFGCDYSTGTYKIVVLHTERNEGAESDDDIWISKVRAFNLGDSCWRYIQSFPLIPLVWNDGVHLSGTINWLSIHGAYISMSDGERFRAFIPDVKQLVIVSLDLSSETYTQFLLPKGFNEVSCLEPSLRVMMDCLCFSHDFNKTELVVWQMKEFGVHESWSQLFRIEYFNLQINNPPIEDDFFYVEYMKCEIPLLPLFVSKDGDTLILAYDEIDAVITYDQRKKTVKRTRISNELIDWFTAVDYVESLVSTDWKSGDEGRDEDEDDDEYEDQLSDIDIGFGGWTGLY
ncbi:F-box/kelch-repeat protein At3g23880-like [Vicia villosa]|uniref:F-box/kelch-repeat protein At3g23880-like n=1 Tax=Vicia villosa TaxID=3911 RepID=UPI00273B4F2D|nr:F-box/kelch-repeat protein At3g23880-like [Vicia villosa]